MPVRLDSIRWLALAAVAFALPTLSRADSASLSLAEGQVVTLQFEREVTQLAVSELDVLAVKALTTRVEVTGRRGGRTSLIVQFGDGSSVTYDVHVAGARRSAQALAPADPNAVELAVGEQRRLPAGGAARLMLEENGVARVRAEGSAIVVTGLSPGTATLIVVDGSGARTTYPIRVR